MLILGNDSSNYCVCLSRQQVKKISPPSFRINCLPYFPFLMYPPAPATHPNITAISYKMFFSKIDGQSSQRGHSLLHQFCCLQQYFNPENCTCKEILQKRHILVHKNRIIKKNKHKTYICISFAIRNNLFYYIYLQEV